MSNMKSLSIMSAIVVAINAQAPSTPLYNPYFTPSVVGNSGFVPYGTAGPVFGGLSPEYVDPELFKVAQSKLNLEAAESEAISETLVYLYHDLGLADILSIESEAKFLQHHQNAQKFALQNGVNALDAKLDALKTQSLTADYLRSLLRFTGDGDGGDIRDVFTYLEKSANHEINTIKYHNASPEERKKMELTVLRSQIDMLDDGMQWIDLSFGDGDFLNDLENLIDYKLSLEAHESSRKDFDEALKNYAMNPSPESAFALRQASVNKDITGATKAEESYIFREESADTGVRNLVDLLMDHAIYAKAAMDHADLLNRPIPVMPSNEDNVNTYAGLVNLEPNAISLEDAVEILLLQN